MDTHTHTHRTTTVTLAAHARRGLIISNLGRVSLTYEYSAMISCRTTYKVRLEKAWKLRNEMSRSPLMLTLLILEHVAEYNARFSQCRALTLCAVLNLFV